MPHNDTRPVSGPAEHRDEWVTYCSHIDQHGEQFCDCAPPLAEIVAEVERLRDALEDAVQLNPGWRARAIKLLDERA
jgi:methyl coenzyme M reductase gamma subunit